MVNFFPLYSSVSFLKSHIETKCFLHIEGRGQESKKTNHKIELENSIRVVYRIC